MKDKPNEWVSISDLMAGVMAIVMLLLVVSVIQQIFAEHQIQVEKEKGIAYKKKIVNAIFTDMKSTFTNMRIQNLADFDSVEYKITFKDGIFERGSAKITPAAEVAFKKSQTKVVEFLQKIQNGKIYVEGHTDNVPVLRPVTDFQRYGAVYDDNFTLSAARAREARKIILGELSESEANRIIVAGYGSSMPIDPINPEDGVNRRVEIRFAISE